MDFIILYTCISDNSKILPKCSKLILLIAQIGQTGFFALFETRFLESWKETIETKMLVENN